MKTLPDILTKGLDVVFCGLNPGLDAAAAGHHFVGRNNRFWQVLYLAGFTPTLLNPMQDRLLLNEGYGLTTVVARPSAGADEVSMSEFSSGGAGLARKVQTYKPRFVAFLGKKACSAIFGRTTIVWGQQDLPFGNTTAWVPPNPSGRNRGFSLDELVIAYRELCLATGRGNPQSIRR
jgi:double-stranded uracil-DNA glycosylase